MKKYLFIFLGLVFAVLLLSSSNQQYNSKYLDLSDKGRLILNDNKRTIFLNNSQVIINDKIKHKISSISLPGSDFNNISIINNKSKNSPPLIGKHIKTGIKLTNKNNVYLVSIEPQCKIIASYPNPKTKNDKIIIDKSKNILYFYRGGDLLKSYQVATGKEPQYTPEGTFKIANKIVLPDGNNPDSLYGPRWMGLSVPYEKDLRANGKKDARAPQGHKYGIHGTNEPKSIGTYASGGCIRMNNQEVIKFFDMVKGGTTVQIIKNPQDYS